MGSFLTYLEEADSRETIALVGGSFKPFHAGHWDMIEQYSKIADKVIVLISDPQNEKSKRKTNLGTVITKDMAKDIFDLYLKRYGLKNVELIDSPDPSPITAAYKYVEENLHDCNVIFGVSKKGGDWKRYSSAKKYFSEKKPELHIDVLDPQEYAVDPYVTDDGEEISATTLRANIDNKDVLKKYLPKKLTDDDINKFMNILSAGKLSEQEAVNMLEAEGPCVEVDITDDLLKQCKIKAYNIGQTVKDTEGKEVPVNPKKFPDKAVQILLKTDVAPIEIYLDTPSRSWDSNIKMNGRQLKLSPDQFGSFFKSEFYQKLSKRLAEDWPLKDVFYKQLYNGILNKQMKTMSFDLNEDGKEDDDGPKYSSSGRKIVSFSDFGVKNSSGKYYCWPKDGKEFRWSTWSDWKKQKPLARIRFKHGDRTYGVSISTYNENYENRGWRGYDLDHQPPLAWLTPAECSDVMNLSIFRKFTAQCVKRIQKYIDMDSQEIYDKINNPSRVTIQDIDKTKSIIRKVLNSAIKERKADTFSWK